VGPIEAITYLSGPAASREMDAAAKADPVHAPDQVTEALFDHAQHRVEPLEIGILAIVVEHEAGHQIRHRLTQDRSFLPKVKTALDKLDHLERKPRPYTSMKEI